MEDGEVEEVVIVLDDVEPMQLTKARPKAKKRRPEVELIESRRKSNPTATNGIRRVPEDPVGRPLHEDTPPPSLDAMEPPQKRPFVPRLMQNGHKASSQTLGERMQATEKLVEAVRERQADTQMQFGLRISNCKRRFDANRERIDRLRVRLALANASGSTRTSAASAEATAKPNAAAKSEASPSIRLEFLADLNNKLQAENTELRKVNVRLQHIAVQAETQAQTQLAYLEKLGLDRSLHSNLFHAYSDVKKGSLQRNRQQLLFNFADVIAAGSVEDTRALICDLWADLQLDPTNKISKRKAMITHEALTKVNDADEAAEVERRKRNEERAKAPPPAAPAPPPAAPATSKAGPRTLPPLRPRRPASNPPPIRHMRSLRPVAPIARRFAQWPARPVQPLVRPAAPLRPHQPTSSGYAPVQSTSHFVPSAQQQPAPAPMHSTPAYVQRYLPDASAASTSRQTTSGRLNEAMMDYRQSFGYQQPAANDYYIQQPQLQQPQRQMVIHQQHQQQPSFSHEQPPTSMHPQMQYAVQQSTSFVQHQQQQHFDYSQQQQTSAYQQQQSFIVQQPSIDHFHQPQPAYQQAYAYGHQEQQLQTSDSSSYYQRGAPMSPNGGRYSLRRTNSQILRSPTRATSERPPQLQQRPRLLFDPANFPDV